MDDILLDDILNNKAKQERLDVPEGFSKKRHSTMASLPERNKYHRWRIVGLQAAIFALIFTALAFSGIYIKSNENSSLMNIRNLAFKDKLDEKDFRSKEGGEFVFRKVKWGVSPEECFKAEGIPFDERNLDFSLYNNSKNGRISAIASKESQKIFGQSAVVAYFFDNNKFSMGQYSFEFTEEQLRQGLDFFKELEKELIKKYGMPVNTNYEPPMLDHIPDEGDMLDTSASWTMDGVKPLKSTMMLEMHRDKSSVGNNKRIFISVIFNGDKLLY